MDRKGYKSPPESQHESQQQGACRAPAYYNENDPFAAAWLRELQRAGQIMEGPVDERSIADVDAAALAGYGRCHFFAGIAGWDLALQLAGWPDDREVWTGSCPCQPLSGAGLRRGHADERHLWPAFYRLIAECRPATVFGEQVASKDGREWLAGIRADLEGLGYAVGAADLCAAGVGAPHIRQRLFWVADADGGQSGHGGLQRSGQHRQRQEDGGAGERLEIPSGAGLEGPGERTARGLLPAPWAASIAIPCADGKFRRVPASGQAEVESSLFPLAAGLRNRMGALRGAGNAIVPQTAALFIAAFLESA